MDRREAVWIGVIGSLEWKNLLVYSYVVSNVVKNNNKKVNSSSTLWCIVSWNYSSVSLYEGGGNERSTWREHRGKFLTQTR